MSSLSACHSSNTNRFVVAKEQAIIGGKNISVNSQFANRVIYLSLGVEKKKTPNGFTISQKEICTASAITTRILITAAHCVKDMKADQVYAVMTLNPWNHPLNLKEWIVAEKIKVNEHYVHTDLNIDNDLAIIKLSKDISPERVSKIADATQTVANNLSLVAIGYGQTTAFLNPSSIEDNSNPTQIQKQNSLLNYVMKTVETFDVTAPHFQIDQGDFKGICQGDSGGPGFIFDVDKKEFFILGITSYVSIMNNDKIQRDPSNKYNLCIGRGNYTNLLVYKDWIAQSLNELK
jgi:secreted trypsin-like serine protease